MNPTAQQSIDEMRLRRLHWLCRRGMKELDVLLEAFIKRHSAGLLKGEWPEFEALLKLEDDRLWDCLLDPAIPAAGEFQRILADISHVATHAD